MGSIWLVSTGEYDDYRIAGVYDSEELARRFAATLDDDDVEVEEWEVNRGADALMAGRVPFRVSGGHHYEDGSLLLSAKAFADEPWNEALEVEEYYSRLRSWTTYTVCVWAKTAKEAIEMAREKILAYTAASRVVNTGLTPKSGAPN